MDLSRRLEDYPLVILDLETTGLNAVLGDAICEIGALKVKDRKVIDKFHSLVNPQRSMPPEAYQVHKISEADLKQAPSFEQVAAELVNFLNGCVLCAYNVEFDLGFIDQSLKKINQKPLAVAAVDILIMARDVLTLPRYN
ncbi:MAG: 3'-5' exonuclease, partial [Candidatus Omnitrophica bacterium]|nr:3'-5' exonuclease [Candidatus Omnitrophota bacterium]